MKDDLLPEENKNETHGDGAHFLLLAVFLQTCLFDNFQIYSGSGLSMGLSLEKQSEKKEYTIKCSELPSSTQVRSINLVAGHTSKLQWNCRGDEIQGRSQTYKEINGMTSTGFSTFVEDFIMLLDFYHNMFKRLCISIQYGL